MSANNEAYSKLFGDICDGTVAMARCACVACNSCTCACSCHKSPENSEIEWQEGASKMSANNEAYSKLYGEINDGLVVMAKCACVACNSCVCACSCRNVPEFDDVSWE